jgi:hypothetical protein
MWCTSFISANPCPFLLFSSFPLLSAQSTLSLRRTLLGNVLQKAETCQQTL